MVFYTWCSIEIRLRLGGAGGAQNLFASQAWTALIQPQGLTFVCALSDSTQARIECLPKGYIYINRLNCPSSGAWKRLLKHNQIQQGKPSRCELVEKLKGGQWQFCYHVIISGFNSPAPQSPAMIGAPWAHSMSKQCIGSMNHI